MKTRRRRSTPSRESSAAVSAATATLMSSRSGAGGASSKSLAAGTDSLPAAASESGAAAISTFATAASNAPSSSGGGRESRSKSRIHGSQTASESHAGHGHGHCHGEVQIISAVSPAASSDDKKISQGEMPSKKLRHATHPRRHGEKNTIASSPANNPNHKQKHPPKQPSHPSEHQELEPAGTDTATTTPALKNIPKKPSRPPSKKQTPLPSIRQTSTQNITNVSDPDPTRAEPPALPHRPLVLLGEKPRGLYECDYCRADLTRVPRIRCATCPDFDLCLDCFATSDHERIGREKRAWVDGKLGLLGADGVRDGREGGGGSDELGTYVHGEWIPFFRHRPDHGYVVADSARFALFPSFRGVRAVPVVAEDDSKDEGEGRVQVVGEEGDKGDENGANVSAAEEKNNQTKEATDINNMDNNIVTETGVSARDSKVESMEVNKEDMSGEKTSETAKGEDPTKTEDKSKSNMDPSHSKDEATPTADSIACDTDPDVKGNDDSDDDESPKTNQTPKPKFEYRLLHEPKQTPHHAGNHATSWTAEEDLRLLDAILTCGLGNWPDIADHVSGGGSGSGSGSGSGGGDGNGAGGDGTAPSSSSGATGSASSTLGVKTEKKCMERYLDDFLGRYGHILPPYILVPLPLEDPSDMDVDVDDGEGTDAATAIDTINTTANDRKRRRRQPDDDDDASPSARKKQKYRVLPTDQLEGYDAIWPDPYIPSNMGVKRGDPVGRDLWYKSEQDYIKTLSKAGSKIDAERIKAEFLERRAKNMAGYEAKVLPPRMDDIRTMPGCELAGYMPRRGDFDMEWDNDAEKMIADMEFSSDDSPEDQELKLEVIRIFNTKLDERERRKKFILDRKLLNYREHQAKMWALPPDERHLVHRMRLFARFHSREEHEAFVQKILEAKRLRKEIAKLHMYRRMGIRSLADAEKFELDKLRREYHIAEWQKKEAEKKKAEADAARAAKENAEGAIVMKSGGVVAEKILGSSANQSMSLWRQYKSIESVRKSRRGTDSRDFDASEVETKSPERSTQTQSNTDVVGLGIESKDSQKFVIKDKPGYELLSSKEIALCKRLKLLPRDYLNVKKALLSGALTGGLYNSKLSKSKGTLATVDITQRDNVIDFVLRAGWIPSRPTLTD